MKLQAKLFLPILLFSLLLGAYVQWIWLPRITDAMVSRVERDGQAHLTSVAEGLIPLLLEGQLANVYENLDALLEQNHAWLSIKLISADGHQLYPLDGVPPLADSGAVRLLHQPVGFWGPDLARLEVSVDFAPVLAEAVALQGELRLALALLLGLFVVVIIAVLEWLVRRRLQQLAWAADQLAGGNYDVALPKTHVDEIGALVDSFVSMRDALRTYHFHLRGEIHHHQRAALVLTQEKDRANYQASHDALTGLVNRAEFERRLASILEQARQETRCHALLYLDLDRFKVVNDTCGHLAGDALLQQLVVSLQDHIRQHDTLARLGGDEFGVLLKYCCLEDAAQVAENLRQAVQGFHFSWDGKTFSIGVSIGVVAVDATGDVTELLKAADSACYMAKALGRNRLHVSEASDQERTRQKVDRQWTTRLTEAVDADRLTLFCQPVMAARAATADCRHYEVLLRLREDDGQLTLPGAFLPAAERHHLTALVDRWVVDKVFTFLGERQFDTPIVWSLNLSGASLADQGLLEHLETRLKNGDAAGHRLCFEISESAAIIFFSAARHFMQRLAAHGCYFALDNFGGGVSSFSSLKSLPVTYLKIDGALIQQVAVDPVNRAVVHAMGQIGHAMQLETIAVFVENQQTLEELRAIGIDYVQGYHIRRPFPLSDIIA
jgi:diguanylate cyclase (GGDEF)-like protein